MTDTSSTTAATTSSDATATAATTSSDATAATTAATPATPKYAVGDVVKRTFHSFPTGEVTQAAIVCSVFPDEGNGVHYALAPLPGQTGPVAESELAAV